MQDKVSPVRLLRANGKPSVGENIKECLPQIERKIETLEDRP